MELPEQYTSKELQKKVDDRIAKLEESSIPKPSVSVTNVSGAVVEESARGALVVTPNTERVVSLSYFSSSVAITYEGLRKGYMRATTGSARLIRIEDAWRKESLFGRWEKEHVFESPSRQATLTFHVPPGTSTPILPPEPSPPEYKDPAERYDIPPPATAIKGQGIVHYRTGHTLAVDGEQLLLRPASDGTLSARPGGVYAEFESSKPPEVKIGTAWIKAKPVEAHPKA